MTRSRVTDPYNAPLPLLPSLRLPTPFSVSPAPLPVRPDLICFTDNETFLINLFYTSAKLLQRNDISGSPIDTVTVRLVGGFVRDKLIAKSSSDMDVTVEGVSPADFGLALNTCLHQLGRPIHRINVIPPNPELSKHLETAIGLFEGQWIDICTPRSDCLPGCDNTFLLTIDAHLRDLTINSLFYNVMTGAVEDLTGRGLLHLTQGVIDTPREPQQTFEDDPIRSLRAIRFACTFGYRLSSRVMATLTCDGGVHAALLTGGVSRERIGIEVLKILKSSRPIIGLQLIAHMKLFVPIFLGGCMSSIEWRTMASSRPLDIAEAAATANEWGDVGVECAIRAFMLMKHKTMFGMTTMMMNVTDGDNDVSMYLAALLLPFSGCCVLAGKKRIPMPEYVIKECLKIPHKYVIVVQKLHNGIHILSDFMNYKFNGANEETLSPSILSLVASVRASDVVARTLRREVGLCFRRIDCGLPHDLLNVAWRLWAVLRSVYVGDEDPQHHHITPSVSGANVVFEPPRVIGSCASRDIPIWSVDVSANPRLCHAVNDVTSFFLLVETLGPTVLASVRVTPILSGKDIQHILSLNGADRRRTAALLEDVIGWQLSTGIVTEDLYTDDNRRVASQWLLALSSE